MPRAEERVFLMDLRVKRTRRSIMNAFIHLRAERPIEKITVKELAEKAMINKATFYLHYKDIYDLSEQLEDELLDESLAEIPEEAFLEPDGFRQMAFIFSSPSELFTTLFSGSRVDHAVRKLDRKIKEIIFAQRPELKDDLAANAKLTAAIYGCFHAFFLYKNEDFDTVTEALAEFCTGKILS